VLDCFVISRKANRTIMHHGSNLLPSDDIDYDFLLSGVKNGFPIVDHMPQFNSSVLCDNYRSALSNKRLVSSPLKFQ
jgi:hypothetical protein